MRLVPGVCLYFFWVKGDIMPSINKLVSDDGRVNLS